MLVDMKYFELIAYSILLIFAAYVSIHAYRNTGVYVYKSEKHRKFAVRFGLVFIVVLFIAIIDELLRLPGKFHSMVDGVRLGMMISAGLLTPSLVLFFTINRDTPLAKTLSEEKKKSLSNTLLFIAFFSLNVFVYFLYLTLV